MWRPPCRSTLPSNSCARALVTSARWSSVLRGKWRASPANAQLLSWLIRQITERTSPRVTRARRRREVCYRLGESPRLPGFGVGDRDAECAQLVAQVVSGREVL